MGVMIPPELIADIKRANPLREVMARYGMKVNSQSKVVCPFHKDSDPSLHVYEDNDDHANDSYYCYVCEAGTKGLEILSPDGEKFIDKGSDVIAFIQNKERLDNWKEALKMLAAYAGIDLPEEKKDPEAERMKNQVTQANREFYHALKNDADALAYLAERGIDEHDIDKWRLGMVPWDWADKKYAGRIVFGMTEVNYQPDKAKTVAMAYRIRDLEDYVKHGWTKEDMDRNLFPKYDEDGDVKSINPKYYNDPTSRVYEKKHYLYGLNQALPFIRKYGFVCIMEGYTDVIAAHKNGLPTSVASCGTSITEKQVELLAKVNSKKKVFLWLDGDAAGAAAMRRAMPLFLKYGFTVYIVDSPGLDPADVAASYGSLFDFIRTRSKPAVQLVMEQVTSKYDALVNQARIEALEELLPLMDNIKRPADRANYLAQLENKLNVRL